MASNNTIGVSIGGKKVPSNNTVNVPADNNAYQQNVANIQVQIQPTQPVEWNTRSALGRISQIAQKDQEKANLLMTQFNYLQQDKNSKYYNPYATATNRSVANLAAYGVDTSKIDDNFYKNNSYLFDYLSYDGTTNTPTKPGKKASAAEKAAYEFYQIWKSEGATKKAEQQWKALQQELSYWANRKDQNLSDDEIISRIDWSKYGELTSMDENKLTQPPEYNRAIGYSKDALYGVLWQARNPEYKGDIYGAMANSYNGKGNVYKDDPEIRAKRTAGTAEFNPYSLGGVGIDDAAVYYGADTFDRKWLSEHQADAYSTDETRKKMYGKVLTAVNNTEEAEKAIDALNKYMTKRLKNKTSDTAAQKILDEALADGTITVGKEDVDISILNKLDNSIGKGTWGSPDYKFGDGKMVPTTKALNYKYIDFLNKYNQVIEENKNRIDGQQTLDSMNDPASYDEVHAGAEEALAAGTKKAAANAADEAKKSIENEKILINEKKESGAKSLAQQVAGNSKEITQEEATQMLFGVEPGVNAVPKTSPASIESAPKTQVVKAQTEKISNAVDILESKMAPTEKKYIENLPGVNGTQLVQSFSDAVNGALIQGPVTSELTDPEWVKKMATKKSVDTEKEYLDASFGSLALRTRYEKAQNDLASVQEQIDEYNGEISEKMRSLQDNPEEVDVQIDNYTGLSISFVQDSNGRYVLNPNFDMENPALQSYMIENGMSQSDLIGRINSEKKRLNQNAALVNRAKEKYPELTEEEIASLPTQNDIDKLNAQAASLNKYLVENQEAYDEAVKNKNMASDKRGIVGNVTLRQSGMAVDPAISDNVISYVGRFTDYEVPADTPDSLVGDLRAYYGDSKIKNLDFNPETAREEISAYVEDMDDQIASAQYVLDHYELPEEYQTNISNYIGYMNRQKRLYNNYMVALGDDFDSLVEEGKEIYWQSHIDVHESEEASMEDNKTGWGQMTGFEQDMYYALCAAKGVEAAEEYYQDIEGSLIARVKENLEEGARESAQSGFFGRLFNELVSIGTAPFDVIASALYMANTTLTGKENKWLRVPAYASKAASTEVQREVKNLYGDGLFGQVASGFWEIINNRGRSAMTGLTFGGFFPEGTNDIIHAFPIAVTAAGESFEKAMDNDLTMGQALGLSAVTFLAESVTEGIEFGHMRKALEAGTIGAWKDFWMSRIPDALSEMIGESINDIVERWADTAIAGDKSDRANEIKSYIDAGYLPEDAELMVDADEFRNVLHTAIISAISPIADVGSYAFGRLETTAYYAQQVDQLRRMGDANTTIRDLRNRDVQFMKNAQELEEQELRRELKPFYANEKKTETAPDETATAETAEAETASAETEEVVAEETAPEAPAETAAENYDRSIMVIMNAEKSDATTMTAAIAGALDVNDSEMHTAVSAAVASELIDYYGNSNVASFMMTSLLNGGKTMGYDPTTLKSAIRLAMLTEGECKKTFTSEAYAYASPENQARMLMQAFAKDSVNPAISEQLAVATRNAEGYEAEKKIIAETDIGKQIEAAKARLAEAQTRMDAAGNQVHEQLSVLNAKQTALKEAQKLFDSDPNTYKDVLGTAVDEFNAAYAVYEEYEQRYQNARQNVEKAKADLESVKGSTAEQLHTESDAVVTQQETQRQQAKAEAERIQAKQEAKAAEEQAKAQAEEDERTGKTQEQEQMEKIDRYVDSIPTDPETRERLRSLLKERQLKKNVGDIDLSKRLTDAEAILALGALQRKLGLPIVFSNDLGDKNGKYENGVVYLNAKKAQDGTMRLGQALLEYGLHEITHGLQETKHYKQYRDIVIGTLYGFGEDFDADKMALDIKRKQEQYAKHDVTLTPTEAEQEIVADFARLHLADKDVVQRMMDAGLAGRIRNVLHNINQALKNFFGKMTGEERAMAENLRKAERAYQKALTDLSRTTVHPGSEQFSIPQFAQATDMTYDPKTQTLYNQKGEKVDGVKVKITRQDIAQTPVGKLIDIGISDKPVTDKDGNVKYLTEADGTPVLDAEGNPVVMTQKNAALEMFSGLMNMIAMLKDQNLVWEIAGSTLESTFSALKSNSDTQYHDTIDFGTICAKTQAIVNVMSNVMLDRLQANKQAIKEGRPQDVSYGLTREDVLKIYNETHKAGLSVPCPVCYVFSRWMGVPSLLGSMSRFQHDYVDAEYDADGNLVLDENGYGKFNRETTQKKANEYIRKMHERYTDKDGVNDRKTKVTKEIEKHENQHVKIATEIETIKGQLEQKNLTEKKRTALETKLSAKEEELVQNARETTELDNELRELEAYNWITQSLFKQVKYKNSEGKQVTENVMENGEYIIDPDFQLTPDEVLMDMRRTGEFAERYAKNWAYRTSRGAGMGKTILPYSGASLGDILLGSKTRVGRAQNPFFTGYDNGKAMKALDSARERARRQNLIGGQRLQSTSDFRPEWGLDYIMAFLELQAAGSNAQMYTKVSEAVDLFASAGADVNLSIMGQGQGYHEATPEEIELAKTDTDEGRELQSRMGVGKDGTVYVMDFSSVTGMDYNTAKEKTKKYDNAQMILVGMNDQHIRLAMANGDIDFIIPWHSSGNSKDVLSQLVASVEETLETSADYTSVQTDGFIQKTEYYTDENGKRKSRKVDARTKQQKDAWSARIKILTGIAELDVNESEPEKGGLTEDEWAAMKEEERTGSGYLMDLYRRFYVDEGNKCYHVALTASQAKQIFPYEYWQTDPSKAGGTKETADENGLRFIAYCQAFGVTPRFSGKMDKKSKKESANFAGAIFDQKTGDIIGYDPAKMDKGYWKLLIDRKMYGNDGKYREQRTIDTSGINIGSVEDGKISDDSMLPREASAKYGIASLEQQAARASERIIEKPFDLEESSPGGQALFADDYTEADLDEMLMEAGIKEAKDISEVEWEDILTDEDYKEIEHDLFGEEDEEEEIDTRELITAAVEDLKTEFDPTIFDGKLYVKPETLDFWLSGSGFAASNPNYAQAYITTMNPADFLRITTTRPAAQQGILDETMPLNTNRLAENAERQPIQLTIDEETGKIIGHEGRHRAIALARAGVKQIPVLLFDMSTKYSKTSKEEMTLEGQNPAFDSTVRNGNTITFRDVIPLSQGNREEITKRFTASDEERQIAEERGQRVLQYSVPGEEFTEAELDEMLQAAGIQEAKPIHNIRRVISSLGWTTHKAEDGTRQVFDENNNLVGVLNGDRVEIDPDNPNLAAYRQALNGVKFKPGATEAKLEGENPLATTSLGPAVRAFASDEGMLMDSDELDRFAKAVVNAQNTYYPETNAAQLQRAITWIRSLKTTQKSDGYAEALQAVTDPTFDYRSADGQARMVAVMAMAAAKNDVMAQVTLADAFMRQGTDLGRALQARKLFRMMTPQGRINALEKLRRNTAAEANMDVSKLKFSELLYHAAAVAENEGDFERVYAQAALELAEQVPANWRDKIRAWRMLSMLGNPRTHIRNIVGNLLFVPMVGIKNKIGAAIEIGTRVKPGQRTKTLGLSTKEARAFAKQDAKVVESELRGETKYDDRNAVKREQKTFGTGNGILSRTLGRGLQALMDFNSNALELEDWFFLRGHYQRALGGYMTANNLTAADMTGKTLEDARAYAINEAQKATYRDANSVAKALSNLSKRSKGTKYEKGANALQFVVDAVVPFKKTPANILRRGIEYSPLGLISVGTDIKALVQTVRHMNDPKNTPAPNRTVTPSQFIDKISSTLTGSGVMFLGAVLGMMGAANAGFDDDDPEDRLKQLEGEQKYGVNFGKALNSFIKMLGGVELFGEDVTKTMDWAAPASMPFFTGVAIAKQLMKEHGDDPKMITAILDAIAGITEPVFNLSMLDGVNSLFNVSQNDPMKPALQIAMKVLLNYGSSMVPTLFGQVARIADPTRRQNYVETGSMPYQAYSTAEQIQNKIPGWSQENIAYRNVYGEEEKNGSALETLFAPWYSKTNEHNQITEETREVFDNLTLSQREEHSKLVPSKLPQSFKVGNTQIRLTDKEYQQFQITTGETATKLLTDMFQTDEYKMASADTKASMIEMAWDYAIAEGKKSVVSDYEPSTKWMKEGNKNGDVLGSLVNQTIDNNMKTYVDNRSLELTDLLGNGDIEMANALVYDMKENMRVDEDKIREVVSDYYRPLYYKAYANEDYDMMEEIKSIMTGFDIGYSKSTFSSWNTQAKKQANTDEEDEEDLDTNWLNVNH